MTHVIVAPHPDDAALSCGGLIASLRELGQNVAVLTLYSGTGSTNGMTPYQREALGFGSKTLWPATVTFNRAHLEADYPEDSSQAPWQASPDRLDATQVDADAAAKRFWQRSSWYRRANIHAESIAGQAVIDDLSTQGDVLTAEVTEAAAAGDAMATRRLEDERFAAFAEVSMVWLDLPDAVFRGYEGDDQLLGEPRADDEPPVDLLRREIARLEPQRIYLPMGVGGHVDHRLARDAGLALLGDARKWVMPGPDYVGQVVLYEDFPYAWWEDFGRLDDMPPGSFAALPDGISLTAEYADISDQLERKVRSIAIYESQIERLFDTRKAMADAVRGHAAQVGAAGRVPGGLAERYWVTTPA
jgi:LmbE family N-acetylglucosaminyl deacetylase